MSVLSQTNDHGRTDFDLRLDKSLGVSFCTKVIHIVSQKRPVQDEVFFVRCFLILEAATTWQATWRKDAPRVSQRERGHCGTEPGLV